MSNQLYKSGQKSIRRATKKLIQIRRALQMKVSGAIRNVKYGRREKQKFIHKTVIPRKMNKNFKKSRGHILTNFNKIRRRGSIHIQVMLCKIS